MIPSISKLKILDRDGNPKCSDLISGTLEFAGGFGVGVKRSGPDISLSVDPSQVDDDPVFKAKWLDITRGGGGFSGPPYYVSALNGEVPAKDGYIYLLGQLCSQIGMFPDNDTDIWTPSKFEHTLELFDMCEACLDCGDYMLALDRLKRIESWLAGNKDRNLVEGTKLYKQYQASVHYWNYLVHVQSIPFKVFADGSDIRVKVGYRCLDCGPFDDVTIVLTPEAVSGGASGASWSLAKLDSDPTTLDVAVWSAEPESASSDDYSSGSLVITIDSIDKDEWALLDLVLKPSDSGSESEDDNEFKISAKWIGTHLGEDVTRTKRISVEAT